MWPPSRMPRRSLADGSRLGLHHSGRDVISDTTVNLQEPIIIRNANQFNMRIQQLRVIIVLSGLVIAFIVAQRVTLRPNALSLELVSQKHDDTYRLYYKLGRGFNQTDSLQTTVEPDGDIVDVHFFALPTEPIRSFRIGLGTHPGTLVIQSIRLQHEFAKLGFRVTLYEWTGARLIEDFEPRKHISEFSLRDDRLQITATGRKPSLQSHGDLTSVYEAIEKKIIQIRLGVVFLSVLLLIGSMLIPRGIRLFHAILQSEIVQAILKLVQAILKPEPNCLH